MAKAEAAAKGLEFKNWGTNIEVAEDEKYIYVRADKSKRHGDSKSGKTVIVGTTQGNKRHECADGVEIIGGINFYVKKTEKE